MPAPRSERVDPLSATDSWARRQEAATIRAPRALLIATALLAGVACGRPAAAQLGIDLQAGTLGVGGGVSWSLAPQLAVRAEGNGFPSISRREKAGDNSYNAQLDLGSAAGLVDWHPFTGGFRISAGALYDANKVEGDSIPSANGNYVIGPVQLPASVVGTLHGKVDFASFAPYLGIGWAPPPQSTGLGFFADLGVAYQGRPNVTLTPEPPPGSPLNSPIALSLLAPSLAIEAAKIESKIDGYRYFPVLSLGLAYRF
jgi:hypothetical protein